MLKIIFEDEHLLVVDKPTGVLSQPGKTVDGSIATLAREAYPDATGPMLVHRLDMDTSGLLLLAKSVSAHRLMQQQFEHRKVAKRYVAILSCSPEGQGGCVRLPLRLDVDNRPVQIVCHEHGKASETFWRRVEKAKPVQPNNDNSLLCATPACTRVEFFPFTGRTHQLRVHAADTNGLNAPIVGDRLYGIAADRLLLHAEELRFQHPVTHEPVKVRSPAPF